jgi:AcrR family transcriptional regulator
MSAPIATPRAAETRDRIQLAFLELVGERGYTATALADVAAVVGVSKGAIHHHYGNKEALLAEAGHAYMGRRDHELAHAFANLDDPLEQIGADLSARSRSRIGFSPRSSAD